MSIRSKAWSWNATEQDWWAFYPCDRHIAPPYREMMRAIDVQAPVEVVYRWICQLKLAPYSYDWIDNFGRRSPRQLTPGAEHLEVGESLGIGPIVEFEQNHHLTAVADERFAKIFGALSVTYLAKPTGAASSRLVIKLDMGCRGWWEQVRVSALAWGDLIMTRKQLLTLKALAEETAQGAGEARPVGVGAGVGAA